MTVFLSFGVSVYGGLKLYNTTPGKIEGLDGLRALAALLVFAAHATVPYLGGGGIGVDVFFAISGFLITRTFLMGGMNLEKFWIYRALRIYPPLLFAVIIGCFVIYFFDSIEPLEFFNNFIPPLMGVANFARIYLTGPTFMGHYWSIGVEEQFYLVYPLILILMTRFSKKYVPHILISMIFFIVVYRIGLFKFLKVPDETLFQRPDTRADGLLWGAFLAVSSQKTGRLLAKLWPLALLFLGVAAHYEKWWQEWLYLGGFSALALASSILIASLVTTPRGLLARVLSFYPLRKLGELSYGFYLWHLLVIRMVGTHMNADPFVITLIELFITYALALLSWNLIEQRILARRGTLITSWSKQKNWPLSFICRYQSSVDRSIS